MLHVKSHHWTNIDDNRFLIRLCSMDSIVWKGVFSARQTLLIRNKTLWVLQMQLVYAINIIHIERHHGTKIVIIHFLTRLWSMGEGFLNHRMHIALQKLDKNCWEEKKALQVLQMQQVHACWSWIGISRKQSFFAFSYKIIFKKYGRWSDLCNTNKWFKNLTIWLSRIKKASFKIMFPWSHALSDV